MKRPDWVMLVLAVQVLAFAGCASNRLGEAERLALYQRHAGPPVRQIHYLEPMGWDRIDDQHVVLQMRPSKSWLLHLSGPCLEWSKGSPFLQLSSWNGNILSTFDKVVVADSQLSCQIREIRPLDVPSLRKDEQALRKVGVQSSGT